MIENRETQMRRGTQAVLICLCVFILMSDVLLPMIPWDLQREFLTLRRVLCFSLLSLVLARLPKNAGRTGALLLAVYWIWLMVARLLVGGLSDALPNEITRAGALCAVFYLTRSLDARGRGRLSGWFCGVLFPVLAVLSVLGFLVVLNLVPKIRIGDEYIFIALEPQSTGMLRSLSYFNLHRNATASWFMIALWLAVAQFLRTPKKWLRAVLALFAAMMYTTMAMQHCRSIYVSFSVGVGLLTLLLTKDRLPIQKKAVKTLCILLLAAATTFVSYKGFGLCNTLAAQLARPAAQETLDAAQPAEEAPQADVLPEETAPAETEAETAAEAATEAPAETEAETTTEAATEAPAEIPAETPTEEPAAEVGVADNRNFLRDLLTLTSRTEIWAACLRVVLRRKKFLLLGQPVDMITMNMLYYGDMDRVVGHTHNALLQVLALSGIIGLIVMLAFLFLQLRSALRIYRGKHPLCQKIYPILLASLLIYSIGEPLFDVQFTSLAFMLISGMLEASDGASA